MALHFEILEFGSAFQKESIALRRKILREPLGLDFSIEELNAEFAQTHIAAIKNKVVVGILLFVPTKDKALKMRQVAVSEDCQSSGIGSQLIAFSEKWAIANNYKTIELHARESAIIFYLKLGYQTIGHEFMEVNVPHFKMKKELCI